MIYAENILICIAVPLVISVLFLKKSARRFVSAFLIGMVACLLSAYIAGFLNLVTGMGENDTAVFLSPIVEELMKLMPILFYLLVFLPEDHGLLPVAVGVGAGFATFENCCYILTSGAENLGYVLIRGMAVGVMHIVSILTLTIALIALRRYRAMTFSGVAGALSLAVIFHALYNLLVSEPGISSYVGYALPVLTAAVLYLPSKKGWISQDAAEVPSEPR